MELRCSMHEYSLANALAEQVRDIARQHSATAVTEIVVAAGPLAGVEPLLLASAFEQMATDELLCKARLIIEEVPLTIHCDMCESDSELNDFAFICPHCGADATRVVGGDAVMLRHLVLSQPETEGTLA
jgi:hydrogenase nickel incorporation protein HypA/HybF